MSKWKKNISLLLICYLNKKLMLCFLILQVLVEFDDSDWKRREWIRIYDIFQVFLVERTLHWALKSEPNGRRRQHWPALVSKTLFFFCFMKFGWCVTKIYIKKARPVAWQVTGLASWDWPALVNKNIKYILRKHDDAMAWKHIPHYWPFVSKPTGHWWIPLTKNQ